MNSQENPQTDDLTPDGSVSAPRPIATAEPAPTNSEQDTQESLLENTGTSTDLTIGVEELEDQIIENLRTCYDPEIPVNIYDLGLIYDIQIDPEHQVFVSMTLTSPACPVAGTLPPEVEQKVREVQGVRSAKVDITWDPPWNPEMMSEEARLELNMF